MTPGFIRSRASESRSTWLPTCRITWRSPSESGWKNLETQRSRIPAHLVVGTEHAKLGKRLSQ